MANWLNGRTGSEVLNTSFDLKPRMVIDEIRNAGNAFAVVIGRDTPAITNDNEQIASLVSRRPELVAVGSVDPGLGWS
jgi:hypothetical protein